GVQEGLDRQSKSRFVRKTVEDRVGVTILTLDPGPSLRAGLILEPPIRIGDHDTLHRLRNGAHLGRGRWRKLRGNRTGGRLCRGTCRNGESEQSSSESAHHVKISFRPMTARILTEGASDA